MSVTNESIRYRPETMDGRLVGLHVTVGWVHDGVRHTMTGKLDSLTHKRTVEGEHNAEGVAVMVRVVPAASRLELFTTPSPEVVVSWWRPASKSDVWNEGDFTKEAVPA